MPTRIFSCFTTNGIVWKNHLRRWLHQSTYDL